MPPPFSIVPLREEHVAQVLEVYVQCEDFLALGPVATASTEMVLADFKLSQAEGCTFCGIYAPDGKMLGVFDFCLSGYKGKPEDAYLNLLMIAAPYRSHGLGDAVFRWLEEQIKKQPQVKRLLAGVQVNNPGGKRFWLRQGFKIVSQPTLMPDGTTCVELLKVLDHETPAALPDSK